MDQVDQHRLIARRDLLSQSAQMAGATGRGRVGELGQSGVAAQGDRLYLDPYPSGRPVQKEIDTVARTIWHLGPNVIIGGQTADQPGVQRLLDHAVGKRCVDPGEMSVFMVDETPAERELLFGIVIGFQPDPGAGLGQSRHGTRVGAMRGIGRAIGQSDIREEAFVASVQTRRYQGCLKAHGPGPIETGEQCQEEGIMANPTAAMLVIGDEILSGRTRDANTHHLAGELTKIGIDLREVRVVADDADMIVEAVRGLSDRYDHVFTSGGIGPTHDDITADQVARALGARIDVRDDARAILQAHYDRQGLELNSARLRMARIPERARLIDNPISAAPGFTLGNVHVMAGVPSIFQAMVASVLPALTGGAPLLSQTLRIDRGEGDIAAGLADLAAEFPELGFGSYPFQRDGVHGTNIVVRGTDGGAVDRAIERLAAMRHG